MHYDTVNKRMKIYTIGSALIGLIGIASAATSTVEKQITIAKCDAARESNLLRHSEFSAKKDQILKDWNKFINADHIGNDIKIRWDDKTNGYVTISKTGDDLVFTPVQTKDKPLGNFCFYADPIVVASVDTVSQKLDDYLLNFPVFAASQNIAGPIILTPQTFAATLEDFFTKNPSINQTKYYSLGVDGRLHLSVAFRNTIQRFRYNPLKHSNINSFFLVSVPVSDLFVSNQSRYGVVVEDRQLEDLYSPIVSTTNLSTVPSSSSSYNQVVLNGTAYDVLSDNTVRTRFNLSHLTNLISINDLARYMKDNNLYMVRVNSWNGVKVDNFVAVQENGNAVVVPFAQSLQRGNSFVQTPVVSSPAVTVSTSTSQVPVSQPSVSSSGVIVTGQLEPFNVFQNISTNGVNTPLLLNPVSITDLANWMKLNQKKKVNVNSWNGVKYANMVATLLDNGSLHIGPDQVVDNQQPAQQQNTVSCKNPCHSTK